MAERHRRRPPSPLPRPNGGTFCRAPGDAQFGGRRRDAGCRRRLPIRRSSAPTPAISPTRPPLRKAGRVGEARALLASPRSLATAPTDAKEWLQRCSPTRGSDSGGDKTTAYIARQLTTPAQHGIRETPLNVRDDYTSLAWLAAQIAYKDLRRPAKRRDFTGPMAKRRSARRAKDLLGRARGARRRTAPAPTPICRRGAAL